MLKKFQLLVMAGLLSILLVVPLAEAASSQEQEKACAAYFDFLTNLINDPDDLYIYNYDHYYKWDYDYWNDYVCLYDNITLEQMFADNHFSLADLDGDGMQELLVDIDVGPDRSMEAFKYNVSLDAIENIGRFWSCGGEYYQDPDLNDNYFWFIIPLEDESDVGDMKGYFNTKLFNNGYVFTCQENSISPCGKSIYPFDIYKFDGSKYVEIYTAISADYVTWWYDEYGEFPYKKDYDGDGVIYYLIKHDEWLDYEKNCLTLAEYKKAINDMIGDAQEVIPVWHNITLSNIQQVKNELEQARNKVNVYVNGQKLNFDQPPVYSNDRLLVPVRAISEALGAKLLWDEKTGTVTVFKGSKIIIMTVGDQQVSVNGKPKTLEIAPMNSGGRIMVPLRFLSENLDCQVAWEGNTKTVRITQ